MGVFEMRRPIMKRVAAIALCGVSISALLVPMAPAAAQASAQRTYDIPAQDLATALEEFGRQSGTATMFDRDKLGGARSTAVKGKLSAEAALKRLLAGTGLKARSANGNTFVIGAGARPVATSPSVGDASSSAENTQRGEGPGTRSSENEDIVVTGTHLRGVRPDSSPLTVYTRGDIDRSGASTVEEFARKLPQNFSGVDSTTIGLVNGSPIASNNVTRGAGLDLNGLGAGATLVLVNGHRLAPAGGDGTFVDISMLPLSGVDHVEILSDGASSIYGADAVAGVVNFVMRKDYSGAQSGAQYGAATDGGGRQFGFSQLIGHSWTGGNIMLDYDYHNDEGLRADQRDYIPNLGGPFMIAPQQVRHSVYGSVRQEVTPDVTVSVDGYYAHRSFREDQNNGFVINNQSGHAEQYGGVGAIDWSLGRGWTAQLVGNYSDRRELTDSDLTYVGIGSYPSTFGTRYQVKSGEMHLDGPLFTLPGGEVKASIGGEVRGENFFQAGTYTSPVTFNRNVLSAFGEVFVPFVGSANAIPGVARLELSASARYDHYSDVGSSTDPRLGLLWSPLSGLNFRASWSKAFRVPPLLQSSNSNAQGLVYPVPVAIAPGGVINTLILSANGNPSLQPERSTSYTFGFDLKPALIRNLTFSGTFFDIEYKNRIAPPPLVGSLLDLYSQQATLAPFLDLGPTTARINQIFASEPVTDLAGCAPGCVQTIFDDRLQNISSSSLQGFEFNLRYVLPTKEGEFTAFATVNYITKLKFKSTAGTPAVNLVNTIYNPMNLRARGGLSWSKGPLGAGVTINYQNGYQNNLFNPPGRIGSWTTADLQLSYSSSASGKSLLHGVSLALNVRNLTDARPPLVLSPAGSTPFDLRFDPTNASPLGRVITVSLTKAW
ncbi:MAG: TonB-dependent receptor [Bradyrhizobium sp.]|nr:TonB-dependent receptor [Bradyrhizobium sp.]